MGFLTMLTVLFIGLKLMNYIAWSWWWVLSPTLIPISIAIVCYVLAGLLGGLINLLEKTDKKEGKKNV